MEDMGMPPAPSGMINSLYGEPLDVFCRELLGDGSPAVCYEFRRGIRKHQLKTIPELGALYPGTVKVLQELRDMGGALAICSNADLDYIRFVSESLGISSYIQAMSGIDGEASKSGRVKDLLKRLGRPRAVMVGDRYHDIQAASSNGIPSIGCLYGYGGDDELSEADIVVRSILLVPDAIRELL
jgi:HAD superfamily hydrolase (TIGR01549 family)